jgi:predicted DCC family thiol-disulfide oxidoreductase YuxK
MTSEQDADAPALLAGGPILLYDGDCGVCAASVQWILTHERRTNLRFAALDSPVGHTLRQAAGLPADIDSLIWVQEDAGALSSAWYSEAIGRVVRYVGGPWLLLAVLLALIPRALRDLGYRAFAARRAGLLPAVCMLPSPAQRERFVDAASKIPASGRDAMDTQVPDGSLG